MGPVMPLIAVARAIRSRRPDAAFVWIGSADGPEFDVVDAEGIPFFAIPAGKFRRYFSLRNLIDPFRIIGGFFAAVVLLLRLRPSAVVSAGGFVAVPVVWAAALLRIPVHIHQQDVIPGLANRLSFPFASGVSTALAKSVADFGGRAVHTGNPVRPDVVTGSADAARRRFGIPDDGLPTVLVLGGGTGAAGLNTLVVDALPFLSGACRVLHVTGPGKEIPAEGEAYVHVPYIADGMGDAYALADVVVTRGGMGTLTELAVVGKPAIIVPMPSSHQEANAAMFEREGAARIFDQHAGDAQAFAAAVVMLLRDRAARDVLAAAMRRVNPKDADGRIADMVLGLCAGV